MLGSLPCMDLQRPDLSDAMDPIFNFRDPKILLRQDILCFSIFVFFRIRRRSQKFLKNRIW